MEGSTVSFLYNEYCNDAANISSLCHLIKHRSIEISASSLSQTYVQGHGW